MIDIKRQEEAFEKLNRVNNVLLGSISDISTGKDKKIENGKYDLYGSTGIIGSTNTDKYKGLVNLVARVGANTGYNYLVNTNGAGVTDNTMIIKSKASYNEVYIYNFLSSYNLNKLSFGSGQPLITSSQLKNVKIPKLPLHKQNRVADFLTSLDALIQKQEEYIEELKVQKKGYSQKIFKSNRLLNSPNAFLTEMVQIDSPSSKSKYIEKEGIYTIVDMGGISIESKNIAKKQTNCSKDVLNKNDIVMIKDDMATGEFLGQNIVITEEGKYICGDHVYRLIGKIGNMNYIHYYLLNLQSDKYFLKNANGSAQKSLTSDVIKKIKIPIVDIYHQKKIGDFLLTLDDKIELQELKLKKLKQKKKYYLNKIFQ